MWDNSTRESSINQKTWTSHPQLAQGLIVLRGCFKFFVSRLRQTENVNRTWSQQRALFIRQLFVLFRDDVQLMRNVQRFGWTWNGKKVSSSICLSMGRIEGRARDRPIVFDSRSGLFHLFTAVPTLCLLREVVGNKVEAKWEEVIDCYLWLVTWLGIFDGKKTSKKFNFLMEFILFW